MLKQKRTLYDFHWCFCSIPVGSTAIACPLCFEGRLIRFLGNSPHLAAQGVLWNAIIIIWVWKLHWIKESLRPSMYNCKNMLTKVVTFFLEELDLAPTSISEGTGWSVNIIIVMLTFYFQKHSTVDLHAPGLFQNVRCLLLIKCDMFSL